MKHIFLLAIAILFVSVSMAQVKPAPFKIHEGSRLTYHVEAGGDEYDFIITVKKLERSVVFDYTMTNAAGSKGTVTMDETAMRLATGWVNYFSGGPLELHNETSVFVSQSLIEKIRKGSPLSVATEGSGSEEEEFTMLDGNAGRDGSLYLVMTANRGKNEIDVNGPIYESSDGKRGVRFCQSGDYMFITYMQLDFKIYLTGIE